MQAPYVPRDHTGRQVRLLKRKQVLFERVYILTQKTWWRSWGSGIFESGWKKSARDIQRLVCPACLSVLVLRKTVQFTLTVPVKQSLGGEKETSCGFVLLKNFPSIALRNLTAYTVEPPLRGHPRNKEKCPLNRGVPLIEVVRYKDYMSVNFAGKKFVSP